MYGQKAIHVVENKMLMQRTEWQALHFSFIGTVWSASQQQTYLTFQSMSFDARQ